MTTKFGSQHLETLGEKTAIERAFKKECMSLFFFILPAKSVGTVRGNYIRFYLCGKLLQGIFNLQYNHIPIWYFLRLHHLSKFLYERSRKLPKIYINTEGKKSE